MDKNLINLQKNTCNKYKTEYFPSDDNMIAGVSLDIREGILPINGLRHLQQGNTTGWYIWAGEELSYDPDYFKPLHVRHLKEWCPVVLKFLGLPPGWRFLVAGDYEDVWYDESLLNI